MTQLITVLGSPSRPARTIDCPPRPNGNTPPVPAARPPVVRGPGTGPRYLYLVRPELGAPIPAGGRKASQSLGPVRLPRQCLGMDPGLLARQLPARPLRRQCLGSGKQRQLRPACDTRGQLAQRPGGGCAPPTATGAPRVVPTATSVFVSPGINNPLFSVLCRCAGSVGRAKP